MSKPKILVIDDEKSVCDLIRAYLEPEGYQIYIANDGLSGLKAARAYNPDLIVLDIMLPGMDGIELLTHLRKESDAYVVMLTAKTEEVDKIIGLSVGADDYITKPFSPRELVARIKAALRRIYGPKGIPSRKVLAFKHIRIDAGSREVWLEEEPIELTVIEFDILQTLAEHRGMVLSREQIIESVWGADFYGELRVVDVHIGHIRQKLADEDFISTVRGVGYRFEDKDI